MIDNQALPTELRAAYERLRTVLKEYGSMLVAYSGGVDSALLTYVARDVLGDRMLPVIGVSSSLPQREYRAAVEFLESHEIPFEELETREMTDDRYRSNAPDRCYFCKAELFSLLGERARRLGFSYVAYGANVDDRSDHRPGARAAGEARVISPLVDAGLTKDMIRSLARALNLSLWDKPAAPCLASRIPYFSEVTPEKLLQVERAEYVLKDLGFEVCRVRHHDSLARIEIPTDEHPRILASEVWAAVVEGFQRAGFRYITLDLEGFRSGRLNDVLNERAGSAEREAGRDSV